MIRVHDAYGRELFITREQWRDNVLLGAIEKAWNDPEKLYAIIVQSLQDEFFADMIKPAEQLHRMDTDPARSCTILGIVYLKVNRLNDAEHVLTRFLAKHGANGVVLTNLAKVYSAQGDEARSLTTLWHALEVDPNQDNAVIWYQAIHRDKGGQAAACDALRRVAALAGSWRAQLWLAREALAARDLAGALSLYRESISRAGKPIPTDLLMQISGDLGNQGHLSELINLTAPHFDPAQHGLQVGNNLIKAYVDLGQLDRARSILEQLYRQKRPDWQPTLRYWDDQISGSSPHLGAVRESAPLAVTLLAIKAPIWLRDSSLVAELFPPKPGDGPVICVLGSTADTKSLDQRVQLQKADVPGRLSRALPLFISEQLCFQTNAITLALVPWITSPQPAFVLAGFPWTDDEASDYARQCQPKGDYAIVLHLRASSEPIRCDLRLIRTIDSKKIGELSIVFPTADPQNVVKSLIPDLFRLLTDQAQVIPQQSPPAYQVPSGPQFAYYLLRLEQALAVTAANGEDASREFLSGEREILDGNIHLCLDHPANPTTRLLLIETLRQMKKARPEVIEEFREKVMLLQREKPLGQPAQAIVQRLLDEMFTQERK